MKRINWVGVLLVVFSLVVAGLIAQFRDNSTSNPTVHAKLNQAVEVTAGQTLTVTEVAGGSFFRGETSSSGATTPGLFLVISAVTTTDRSRGLTGQVCHLVTRDGLIFGVSNDRLNYPESGFSLTQDMLFEVSLDQVEGLTLSCIEKSVLTYRETDVRIDLGLGTSAAASQFIERSLWKEVRVAPSVKGVLS